MKDFKRILHYRDHLWDLKFNLCWYNIMAIFYCFGMYFEGFKVVSYLPILYCVLNLQFTSMALNGLRKWQRNNLLWVIVSEILWIILGIAWLMLCIHYLTKKIYSGEFSMSWVDISTTLATFNTTSFLVYAVFDVRKWTKQYKDMKNPRPNTRNIEVPAA